MQDIWLHLSMTLYLFGWLALLFAPIRFYQCWVFARSCAVIIAILAITLMVRALFNSNAIAEFWAIYSDSTILIISLLSFTLFIGS